MEFKNGRQAERTERIDLRVTPAEKERLKSLAAAAGLSLTGFIVGELLGELLGQTILDLGKK